MSFSPGDEDEHDKNYSIGYKRPPINTRFKKGQSGNKKGRPKMRKSLAKSCLDALQETIEVRQGDRLRTITKMDATFQVMLNKAVKGDHRSASKLLDIAKELGLLQLRTEEVPQSSYPAPEAAREKLMRLLEKHASNAEPDKI